MTPIRLRTPSPWQSWHRVLAALVHREMVMRFGIYRLGLLWALLEPAAHVAALLAVLGFATRSFMPTGDPVTFAFLGVCAYRMLRSGVERAAGALESSRALLSYRQVTPAALVIARSAVEQGTVLFVLVAGLCALSAYRGLAWPDPLQFVLTLLGLAVLILGVGLFLAVSIAFLPAIRKLVSFGMRALYLASGVLFPLSVLDARVSDVLVFNPLLQAVELLREATLGWPAHVGVSLSYLWACALVSVFFGLALMRVFRRELEPA
jgi:capsular polysaccharide transport system permease protein